MHRTARVPEEREPVPDQRNRDRDVIERVNAGDRLDRDGDRAGRHGRPDAVTQCCQYAFQRIVPWGIFDTTTTSAMSNAVIATTKIRRWNRKMCPINILRLAAALCRRPFGVCIGPRLHKILPTG
jgi:hypothetical protein